MTTSTAISAQGTTIAIESSGSPGEYTTIGNVKSFSDLESGSSSEIDVTDLTSPEKEYLLGLADPGTFSMAVLASHADPGQEVAAIRRRDGALTHFKITLPTGATPVASFAGFVKKFSRSGAVDAAVTGAIDVRVTGAITWGNS